MKTDMKTKRGYEVHLHGEHDPVWVPERYDHSPHERGGFFIIGDPTDIGTQVSFCAPSNNVLYCAYMERTEE